MTSDAWSVKNLTIMTLLFVPLIVNFPLLSPSVAGASSSAGTIIPLYEITTRDVIFIAQGVKGVDGSGYGNYELGNIKDLYENCYNETAIFVHGWDANESEAKERFDRVKMSLEENNYTYPLIGLSWHSDTEWLAAQFIASWNGPMLADFITSLMHKCKVNQPEKDIKIRLIGHSLGARVILSTLDSLNKNPTWNNCNFKIASVHLMGAAVDDEEVSMNPRDILDDRTNWGSPKSDYGEAIQEEVVHFYNLYSPEDNVLEPHENGNPSLQIYPTFEGDLALGQNGNQTSLTMITLPANYNDTNVLSQIPENSDIDMTDADGDRICDFGLYNLSTLKCLDDVDVGDNHAGYIGFRDPTNRSLLVDDGAMDQVVDDWRIAP
jgi:pimeloyl-ACP methyl ester carboxylesterase